MVNRLILTCFLLSLECVPVLAHETGFGDQVLQPVTAFHTLLALLSFFTPALGLAIGANISIKTTDLVD